MTEGDRKSANSKKSARFLLTFPVKWMPLSLEIVESMPLEGSIFSKFLFLCEAAGFAAAGGFSLSGKHMYIENSP